MNPNQRSINIGADRRLSSFQDLRVGMEVSAVSVPQIPNQHSSFHDCQMGIDASAISLPMNPDPGSKNSSTGRHSMKISASDHHLISRHKMDVPAAPSATNPKLRSVAGDPPQGIKCKLSSISVQDCVVTDVSAVSKSSCHHHQALVVAASTDDSSAATSDEDYMPSKDE
jgi:hypothetical protein